jgi:hypothetical protein
VRDQTFKLNSQRVERGCRHSHAVLPTCRMWLLSRRVQCVSLAGGGSWWEGLGDAAGR